MSDQDSVRMKNFITDRHWWWGPGHVASNNNLGYDCLLISNDRRDLTSDNCDSVFIDSQPWVNPSSHKIRSLGLQSELKLDPVWEPLHTKIGCEFRLGDAAWQLVPL